MFSPATTRRAITARPGLVSASKIVLFLLCLMYLLTYIDRVNVSMASAVFGEELKLDKTQVGFIGCRWPGKDSCG
jgi:sugar phosphate permease